MTPSEHPNINPWAQGDSQADSQADSQSNTQANFQSPWHSNDSGTTQITPIHSLDFLDAMRQNHRNTWILIISLVLLAGLFGYGLGLTWDVFTNPAYAIHSAQQNFWQHVMSVPSDSGIMLALSLAAGMSVWAMIALWRADKMVLSKTEAIDASLEQFPQLHNMVEEIAIAAGVPKPRVVIVPTDVPNAFATGLRTENAIIGVTQGLMNRLNRDEMQGVIAHEMGHIVNGDIRYATIIAVMTGVIVLLGQMILNLRYSLMMADNRREGRGGNVIIVLIVMLAAIIFPIIAKLIQMGISRQREYLADATAVQLTRNPSGLIGALEKIAMDQAPAKELPSSLEPLYIMTPGKMLQNGHNVWLSTHPSLEKRIQRLKALE